MQLQNIKLGFIGAGNMAEAILRGLIDRGVVSADRMMASDPSAERRALIQKSHGIIVTGENCEIARKSDVLILAVKPQVMAEVLHALSPNLKSSHLLISIAAGIRTSAIDTMCGSLTSIIRVMPNTPALIGKGVSVLCAGPRAGELEMSLAAQLFKAVGEVLTVNEDAMDAVTAISGSGPAYLFYWMEAMLKAAEEAGFDPDTAKKLVYGTITGAAALADKTSEPPDTLRARVTSKGGTTEAAIRVLNERGVGDAVVEAVRAATNRSRELSGG